MRAWMLAGLALVTACSPTPPKPLSVRFQPESDLAALCREAGFLAEEPVVQLYRAGKGIVLSDAESRSGSAMFGVPPDPVLARADQLAPGQSETVDGWTALGLPRAQEAPLEFSYKGLQLFFVEDIVATPHRRAQVTDDGKVGQVPDAVRLADDRAIYLSNAGRLLELTSKEAIENIAQARDWELPFRVIPALNPVAIFETERGSITVELDEERAPRLVAAFIALVEQGYWNEGCTFYRVCPWSTEAGGDKLAIAQVGNTRQRPECSLPLEATGLAHVKGSLAMLSDNGLAQPGYVMFCASRKVVTNWGEEYPVFGRIVSGIGGLDRRSLERGEVRKIGKAGLKVLDELRPDDRLLSVRMLHQRRISYAGNG